MAIVTGQRYKIVTVDDSLYIGDVISVDADFITVKLTGDSDFFNIGDTVTIFRNKITTYHQS